MLKYLSPFFVIASSGMHIFCCGIPLLLSILSLGTGFGISTTAFEIEWFERIEDKLMVFSGLALLASIAAHKLHQNSKCTHESSTCSHNPAKKTSSKSITFASILYTVNIIIFLAS